ncbi:MAG: hypothetical protein FIB08_00595 [Candidatus Methanoperedens sp.]|nr:hypothetical protein [Candidatus Methanoperedens sp.]
MSPDVLQQLLDKFDEQKRVIQTERKRIEEHFLNLKTASKDFKPGQMYDEFLLLYSNLFTLWDIVTDYQKMVVMQSQLAELNVNQSSDVPTSQKQISAMMKKLEELEQFQKHILETVANKSASKETKPPEGMYE